MFVTLNEASRRLGRNAHYVKGRVEGLGIKLERAAQCLVMTEADFDRLSADVERSGQKTPTRTTAV